MINPIIFRRMALNKLVAHYADNQKMLGPNQIIAEIVNQVEYVTGERLEVEYMSGFGMAQFRHNNKRGMISCYIGAAGDGVQHKEILIDSSIKLPVDYWSIKFTSRFLIGILSGLDQPTFMEYVSFGLWK